MDVRMAVYRDRDVARATIRHMYADDFAEEQGQMVVVLDTDKQAMVNTADVLPASGTVTLIVSSGADAGIGTASETDQFLCVGWDECGCPVVMDHTGKLRRLGADERVVDTDW